MNPTICLVVCPFELPLTTPHASICTIDKGVTPWDPRHKALGSHWVLSDRCPLLMENAYPLSLVGDYFESNRSWLAIERTVYASLARRIHA